MRKFFIITNPTKDPDGSITRETASYLQGQGADIVVRDVAETGNARHTDPREVPTGTECVLVLGGDGTLMRAAGDLADLETPLLGVNLGTLGYLAGIDRESLFPALDALLRDEYRIESRMMLYGEVLRGEDVLFSHTALNDIVISRDGPPHMITLHNYVNNKYLTQYRADALIVATPTGSTGYNLSAGGPILSPEAEILLMTPLAAHTMGARSVVLPAESRIRIQVSADREAQSLKAVVSFDGENNQILQDGDCVEIRRATQHARLIKIREDSFLEILRRKLN